MYHLRFPLSYESDFFLPPVKIASCHTYYNACDTPSMGGLYRNSAVRQQCLHIALHPSPQLAVLRLGVGKTRVNPFPCCLASSHMVT